MAYEIPLDLINKLQISLRKEANISSYDPNDPSLLNLPSLDETIAELDPSPHYLRCKHCKGRLLRGVKSFICVFCGRERNTEVPPDPINFKNTIACRWLLESLDLDGSEMVGPPVDSKESNRGKSPEQFPMSDLLDLEISWPSESDRKGISRSNEAPFSSKSGLNLAGVDLDNYIFNEKKEITSIVSDEQLPLNKQIDGSESRSFHDNVDLSLFGDVQPAETATRTAKHVSDDSFSGWEANFQSSSSATLHDNSKSIDPFAVSVVNISSPLETTFEHHEKSQSGEVNHKTLSSSMSNDRFQQEDNLWSNSNRETVDMPKQVEQTGKFVDGRTVENADYSSSVSVDWFQDDQWQRGSKKEPDGKSLRQDKDDDSDDAWDDFTTSTSTQLPSDNSRKDTIDEVVPNLDVKSDTDFFSSMASRDSNFTDSSPPKPFGEVLSSPNGTTEEIMMLSEASDLNGVGKENGKGGEHSEGTIEGLGTSGPSSNSGDVQMLLEKMHDLSFMLESHLSVPPK